MQPVLSNHAAPLAPSAVHTTAAGQQYNRSQQYHPQYYDLQSNAPIDQHLHGHQGFYHDNEYAHGGQAYHEGEYAHGAQAYNQNGAQDGYAHNVQNAHNL